MFPIEHLATYLDDHLAGWVVALEVLEHLETALSGTDLATLFAKWREDMLEDRAELVALFNKADDRGKHCLLAMARCMPCMRGG